MCGRPSKTLLEDSSCLTNFSFSGENKLTIKWTLGLPMSPFGVTLCLLLRAALVRWGPHSVLLSYMEMEGTWEIPLNSLFSSSAQDMLAWHIFCQAKILFCKDFASQTQGQKTHIVGSGSLTPVAGPYVQWRGCCQRLPASCFSKASLKVLYSLSYSFNAFSSCLTRVSFCCLQLKNLN